MKISTRALAYISILTGTASTAAAEKCLSGSFILEYEGDCDRETLVEVFNDQVFSGAKSSACDGVTAEEELDAQLAAAVPSTTIEEFCANIYKNQPEVSFTDILKKDDNMAYEKAFFLGHSSLQEEVETTYETADRSATSVLKEDGELVRAHYQGSAQTKKTEWPKLPNFASSGTDSNGEPTCTTNAAMCCWTKDRQANDNNGNCNSNTYSRNCVDANPGDNTDLCFVDLERGAAATGNQQSGIVSFPGDQNQDGGEGAIHCHGLAWANDVNDASARYKGNNLFFVSMYDHMYKRGYVENVPGAPMCGCVEQMPTVTRSDCTEIDATERFRIVYDESTNLIEGNITLVDINFNACQGINNRNNDLWHYMGRLFYEGKIENTQWGEAGRIITNSDCKAAVRAQYDSMGLEYGYDYDKSTFTFVAGGGELKVTERFGHQAFLTAMFEHSETAPSDANANPLDATPILLRTCAECRESHKKVFYRRLTPMPADKDLLYCITDTRGDCGGFNKWGVDFTLHSTYDDAVKGDNAWACPNNSFNYDAPFDGECSPTGARVRNQWTILHWSSPPQKNVGFYVNMAEGTVITEVETAAEGALRIQVEDEFVSEDIGLDTRVEGRVRLDEDGKIYVTGGGHNVWHNNDNFHFYHKDATGDFDITVNVAKFSNIVNSNAKAGIMLRASTAHDSEYISALLSGGKGLRFQKRGSKGNWSHNVGTFDPNPHRPTVWLRLFKHMTTVDMYWSEDGNNWTSGGSTNMIFPEDSFQLGLFVNAHDYNWASEGTFDNFVVNSYSAPSAAPSISAAPTSWEPNMYIGESQENVNYLPGETQTRVTNDAGSGIDGDVDSFWYRAFQRPSSNAFEAVVSVDYMDGWHDGAKGGIMVRDGTGASAANAFVGIYPKSHTGVISQSRNTEGGDTVRHKSLYVEGEKAFVKLSYDGSGTLVAQYKAVESDEWQDIENGTTNITFGDKLLVGVAVTGGGWNNYVDFRYSNFEITDL
mmetsp:Transcript_15363/g.25136  ORF Transcript_15363/g.25136 Transcript_15363/m.25136 type:complete len:992 (-) Transcript_15363:24-2999(-)